MRKTTILFMLAILMSASSIAQEKAFKKYGFGDNWFLQLQAGASYTFSENQNHANFGDLISPNVALGIGKYFNPQVGARLQVGGWEAKSYLLEKDDYYKIKYVQTNLDALWNLTNMFVDYNPKRVFNLSLIAGIGYIHGFKDTKGDGYMLNTTNIIAPRAGLQFDFRLNDDLNLNLEGMGNLLRDDFNGRTEGDPNDITVNVMLGLTYRFNRHGFETVDVIDPTYVQSLNDKVNQLRSDLNGKNSEINSYQNKIDDLERQLAAKPTVVTKSETEVEMNAVVVFRLGSAKLQENQEINIYNAAKYLKQNPDINVIVTGYADKATGTPAINQKLSEQRAQAVFDIMTKTYGVNPNRITVQASGDKEQPFENDEWNRVVIFTVKR